MLMNMQTLKQQLPYSSDDADEYIVPPDKLDDSAGKSKDWSDLMSPVKDQGSY